MERVLDFGCGIGDSWRKLGLQADDWIVIGLDLSQVSLSEAAARYQTRGWRYLRAHGAQIPLADASVNGVLSNVALPYMQIPKALAELRRVLVPGGWLWASIHLPGFVWSEWRKGFPRPRQTVYRSFVLLNGLMFHLTGSSVALSGRYCESCQTKRGMRLALQRAGFINVTFGCDEKRFWCKARTPEGDAVQFPQIADSAPGLPAA